MIARSLEEIAADVAATETHLAALKSELAAVLPKPQPAKKIDDDGVTIRYPATIMPPLPDAAELVQLADRVFAAYPQLRPKPGYYADDFVADFETAFRHIAGLGRAAKPDTGRFLSWWLDHISAIERGAVRGNPYIAAALAQGDVTYLAPDPVAGRQQFYFGLIPYGGRRATAGAWRRVLAGQLPAPAQAEAGARVAQPLQTQIIPSW